MSAQMLRFAVLGGMFCGLAASWGLSVWQMAVLFVVAFADGYADGIDCGIKGAVDYFKEKGK